jgi:hypothetical protein
MQYILIALDGGALAYQCVQNGQVVAYRSAEDGALITPVGGSMVVDANPPTPAWHVEPEPTPEPTPEPVAAPSRRLSKLAYMNRFTDDELAAIYTAAKTVVQVEIFLKKFEATSVEPDGTSIDLDDPRTVAGVQGLEYFQLIGAGRASEILGA